MSLTFGQKLGHVLMALSLGCAIAGGIFLAVTPRQWEAATWLRIDPELEQLDRDTAWGPYFIEPEWEKVACKMVLYQVAENLHLIQRWRHNLPTDREVTKADVYPLLRKRMEVRWPGRHDLIQIRVTTGNPAESAEIANEIAVTYRKITIDMHTQKATSLHQPVSDTSRWVIITERATVPTWPGYPSLLLEMEIIGTAAGFAIIGILLFRQGGTITGANRTQST